MPGERGKSTHTCKSFFLNVSKPIRKNFIMNIKYKKAFKKKVLAVTEGS